MAKFDDLYPDAPPDFVANRQNKFPPVVKWKPAEGDQEEDYVCACGEPTRWINATATQFVCSTECNEDLWNSLMTIFVAQQIMNSVS